MKIKSVKTKYLCRCGKKLLKYTIIISPKIIGEYLKCNKCKRICPTI